MFTTLTLANLKTFLRTVRDQGVTTAITKARQRIARGEVAADGAQAVGAAPVGDTGPMPPLPVDPKLDVPDGSLSLPDPGSAPEISIIVPVYNQWKHTWNCLKTLADACQRHRFEVILADDNSTDETVTAAPAVAHLVVVRDGINRRFLRNCNNAVRVARGQFLVMLNNDTKCAPHAIDHLIEVMLERPRIGIAGSKLVYPDGRLQECGGIVWSDGSAANYGNRQRPDLPEFMHLRQADYCSAAALMIRRELWDAIGGFDDRFAPAYYEDTDLAMAVRKQGFEVVVDPRSVVIHYEGVSNGTDVGSGLKAYQVRNREVFAQKWAGELASAHFHPGTAQWLAAAGHVDRPHVLVVDHYVPEPDRDAGSACTWHYLQSLVGIGCQVIFLGENFRRTEPYTTAMEHLGIEVWVGDWHANHWRQALAKRAGTIDIVLFNRPHITEVFLPEIRRIAPKARAVYFGHDLHFLRERRAAALAAGVERDQLMAQSMAWEQREGKIYQSVDASLTISTDEVAMIRDSFGAKDITTFPGFIYPGVAAPLAVPTGAPTALFVGGFGHAPNHDGVSYFLADIWPRVRAAVPDARFLIVGSQMPESLRQPAPGAEGLGRLSDEELDARYRDSHVVVAPLRFGAGLKGKVVQAMALGLPVVTTGIGIEGLPETSKKLLGSHDQAEAFAARLIGLLTDRAANAALRAEILAESNRHFTREASQAFFKDLVTRLRPNLSWSDGLNHDGWLGRSARLRLITPGRYRLAAWCPPFQFSSDRSPVTMTVHGEGKTLAQLDFPDSRLVETTFELSVAGPKNIQVEFRINRSTVPKAVGSGDDERALALMLVACEGIAAQADASVGA